MTAVTMPKKAMVLAAGEGTRLRPLTERMPKCMVTVGGKPVLEHNICLLRRYGVTDLVINLYHMPDAVISYFGDGSAWDVSIRYSVEKDLLGTAGGLKKVESHFDEPFFVWYGDNLSNIDLHKVAAFHQEKAGLGTVALFYREDPTASGIVGLDDNQRITRFLEKPRPDQVFSNWVSAGVFLLETPLLDYIPANVASDFGHDVLPRVVDGGEALYGYRMQPEEKLWWIDTPVDLQRIREQFDRRKDNGDSSTFSI